MIYTADTINKLKFISFLIVGPYKTGKTESLATLHKLKTRPWVQGHKLVIYDFDRGCQPLIRVAQKEGWDDELVIVRFDKSSGNRLTDLVDRAGSTELYTDFMNHFNHFYDMLEPDQVTWSPDTLDDAPYAIVVDSLTRYMDIALDFTLATRGHKLGGKGVDGRAEYGAQMGKIVETIRAMNSLPCYVVWLAHQQLKMGSIKMPNPIKGKESEAPSPQITVAAALPVVTGMLAETIGAEFGAVLYTDTEVVDSKTSKYLWITRPDGEFVQGAGTRMKEGLPLFIEQDFDLVVD